MSNGYPVRRSLRVVGTAWLVALVVQPLVDSLAAQPAPSRQPAAQAVDTAFLTPRSGTRVRAGSLVQPDTVEVGDPFTFVVTVAVPADARVEWPSIADSAAVVAMREPVRITDQGTRSGERRERAVYTLSAWDVGSLPLGMPEVVVRFDTSTVRVPLVAARVFVRSVLPGDSTLHVPKPARELFPRVVPWWQQWWPALLVLAAIALLWWLWRRRKQAVTQGPAAAALDPFARAIHEFERLDKIGLADAGEAGRYVALALDVMRMYLAATLPAAPLSLTSGELIDAIGDDARVPRDRLLSLLADVDGIKFAARLVSPSRARELAATSRAIVDQVESAERARRAAEEAARREAAEAAARESRDTEEKARRASRTPRGPKAGAGA
jgi:hypothetical protein